MIVISCNRQRKLERIAQLDSEVAQLKEEQEGLARLREQLRQEAGELRRQIQVHRDTGCLGLEDTLTLH